MRTYANIERNGKQILEALKVKGFTLSLFVFSPGLLINYRTHRGQRDIRYDVPHLGLLVGTLQSSAQETFRYIHRYNDHYEAAVLSGLSR